MIFKVLFVCFLAVFLLNGFQDPYILMQSTEYTLQLTIKYLTNFESYIEERRMNIVNTKWRESCREKRDPFDPNEEGCPQYSYRSRIISRNPLIIYIEKFLSQNEIDHFIQLAESFFRPSLISNDNDGSDSLHQHRTSTSAYINRHETHLVKCLQLRFALFQGGIHLHRMEPFQLVKYIHNQQYKPHYDCFSPTDIFNNGGQRVTTFFTYLRSNCSMCVTQFVDIHFNYSLHKQYCDIILCDRNSSKYGIRFRPFSGNTLFWYNVDQDGKGHPMTYHAGHPPQTNTFKIGLNTWTRAHNFIWPNNQ